MPLIILIKYIYYTWVKNIPYVDFKFENDHKLWLMIVIGACLSSYNYSQLVFAISIGMDNCLYDFTLMTGYYGNLLAGIRNY